MSIISLALTSGAHFVSLDGEDFGHADLLLHGDFATFDTNLRAAATRAALFTFAGDAYDNEMG